MSAAGVPTVFVYDAGALIAAERADERVWEMHRRALRRGVQPIVPATVLGQVRRSEQSNLDRLLAGCRIAPLDEPAARTVGLLLGLARRDDVVDAHVVVCCMQTDSTCVTSDWADIEHLSEAACSDRRRRFGRRKVPMVAV